MAGEAILIVDDNPENMILASFLLESEGYAIRSAANASDALDLLAVSRPRLILMDLQMPGMDGYELTRRLKADPSTREIIVVAVTAYAMKGDEARAREAGCDAYVPKPIDTRSLPLTIARLLRGEESSP